MSWEKVLSFFLINSFISFFFPFFPFSFFLPYFLPLSLPTLFLYSSQTTLHFLINQEREEKMTKGKNIQ